MPPIVPAILLLFLTLNEPVRESPLPLISQLTVSSLMLEPTSSSSPTLPVGSLASSSPGSSPLHALRGNAAPIRENAANEVHRVPGKKRVMSTCQWVRVEGFRASAFYERPLARSET